MRTKRYKYAERLSESLHVRLTPGQYERLVRIARAGYAENIGYAMREALEIGLPLLEKIKQVPDEATGRAEY